MSVASRRLTEAHRLTQARIGALTVLQMRRVWRLLDPEDLDGTFEDWLIAATPIVATQRTVSARTAASFVTASKVLQLGPSAMATPILADAADPRALTTSLLVTGPLSVKRAMARGVPLARALSTAEASSAAAAMRHSLDGGRQTLLETLRTDRDARGWRRVASGGACKFCSTLDGKFHPTDNADFPAHDGCSCSQEPVYR